MLLRTHIRHPLTDLTLFATIDKQSKPVLKGILFGIHKKWRGRASRLVEGPFPPLMGLRSVAGGFLDGKTKSLRGVPLDAHWFYEFSEACFANRAVDTMGERGFVFGPRADVGTPGGGAGRRVRDAEQRFPARGPLPPDRQERRFDRRVHGQDEREMRGIEEKIIGEGKNRKSRPATPSLRRGRGCGPTLPSRPVPPCSACTRNSPACKVPGLCLTGCSLQNHCSF